ncbi:hypothetical protein AWB81_08119 [Caballeronia arationis]|jgi:hypothetical protein|uniref:Uncharacterized protein n=1 Tax=Caballeronia arationis TaxID=1777142 RepID=A0A7Z7I4T1_9BURK|nr:hypothetical protein AWB81_08119 [Caballeronia arationis]SOE62761.1 hypothetical protein SAMN05446927_2390 [Caballeronia arationis]
MKCRKPRFQALQFRVKLLTTGVPDCPATVVKIWTSD